MKISSVTLTFDHMTCTKYGNFPVQFQLEINRVNHSQGTFTVHTKFGNFQVKGSKDIWVDIISTKINSLTLTFDHVTRKSTRKIYSLRASPVLSSETYNQKGQEILSGHCLTDRPTNNMPSFFKAGYKNHNSFIIRLRVD